MFNIVFSVISARHLKVSLTSLPSEEIPLMVGQQSGAPTNNLPITSPTRWQNNATAHFSLLYTCSLIIHVIQPHTDRHTPTQIITVPVEMPYHAISQNVKSEHTFTNDIVPFQRLEPWDRDWRSAEQTLPDSPDPWRGSCGHQPHWNLVAATQEGNCPESWRKQWTSWWH